MITKIWKRNTEILFDNNIPHNAILLCEREVSTDELKWHKLNLAGIDIELDTEAKTAFEASEITTKKAKLHRDLIAKIDSEIKEFLSLYFEHEKMSFGLKYESAVKYLTGGLPHDLLIGEAKEKFGINYTALNLELIANRIVANNGPYGEYIGRASARRSFYQTQINALVTYAETMAYELPALIL